MQTVKRKLLMAERGTWKETVAVVLLQEAIAKVFVHILQTLSSGVFSSGKIIFWQWSSLHPHY